MPSDLLCRPARPEDVSEAIPLIHSSGPTICDYMFRASGLSAEDFLRFAFVRKYGMFSHQNHRVAELDGRVVGTVVLFRQPRHALESLATACAILSFYGPRTSLGVMLRGLRTEQTIRPPRAGRLYLGNLGVLAERRGQGVGRLLITDALRHGNPQGFETAALDVAVTNPDAERLYRRLGFKVLAERRFKGPPNSVPDHHYMEARIVDVLAMTTTVAPLQRVP